MILVDTSIWVAHFRHKNLRLENLLSDEFVYCHPLIIGELACGNMSNRREILTHLQELPVVSPVTEQEALVFIEKNRLMGKGLGIVDIHLLASAFLSGLSLWTEDKPMQLVARHLGLLL